MATIIFNKRPTAKYRKARSLSFQAKDLDKVPGHDIVLINVDLGDGTTSQITVSDTVFLNKLKSYKKGKDTFYVFKY